MNVSDPDLLLLHLRTNHDNLAYGGVSGSKDSAAAHLISMLTPCMQLGLSTLRLLLCLRRIPITAKLRDTTTAAITAEVTILGPRPRAPVRACRVRIRQPARARRSTGAAW